MGFFGYVGRTFVKPCVDVKSWVNWPGIRDGITSMVNLGKAILILPKKARDKRIETFNQAIHRLSLTEADLERKKQYLRYHFLIYLVMFFICLIYVIYSLVLKHFFASFITIFFVAFFMVKIWETYFLKFQIEHRELYTIREWWRTCFKRKP